MRTRGAVETRGPVFRSRGTGALAASVLALSLALLLTGGCAAPRVQPEALDADEPTAEDPGALAALSWMVGHWRSSDDTSTSEELWMEPAGELMLGLHRDLWPDRRAFFEYMRIEVREEAVIYLASPRGVPPTPFTLTEVSLQHARFENAEHDFPQRIDYRREGDRLYAEISGLVDGERRASAWSFDRVPSRP